MEKLIVALLLTVTPAISANASIDLDPFSRSVPKAFSALDALAGAAGEPWLVRMTGSGSTCFALYNEKGPRDAALEAVQRRFPGWWTAAAEIL